MFWKLLFVAIVTVGVSGRSVQESDVYAEVIKIYCEANNAVDKIPEVTASLQTFINCLKTDFDIKTMKDEFAVATATKDFDQFFKKTCAKAPQFKTCFHNFTTGTKPCQSPALSESANEYDRLIDFLCENDGAKITLFFKEDGAKCFQEEQKAFNDCNESLKSNITRIVGKDNVLAALKLTKEQRCSVVEPAVECMVTAIKRCKNPVPGQLFEEASKKTTCIVDIQTEKSETTTEHQ